MRALKLKLSVSEIKVPLRVTAKIEVLVSKPEKDEANLHPIAKRFLTPHDREL